MKNVKYLSLLLGLWPMDEFQPHWRIRLYIRTIYRKFAKIYFYTFVLSMVLNVYFTRNNSRKLVDTVMILFALYTTIIKAHICKKKTTNLINYIYEIEKSLRSSSQKEYKRIYKTHVKIHYFMNRLTIFLGVLVLIAYYTFPIMEEYFRNDLISNANERILPIELWLPFDKDEHYKLAFLCVALSLFFTVNYIICLDMFIVGMLIFALGQIKILQEKLVNFTKIVTRTGVSMNELVEECVKEHRRIIA